MYIYIYIYIYKYHGIQCRNTKYSNQIIYIINVPILYRGPPWIYFMYVIKYYIYMQLIKWNPVKTV